MRIIVAAVGRLKQGPETELSARYRKRAAQTGRHLGLRDVEVIEIRESRAGDAGKRMIEESIALANIIPQNAAVVVLNSRGESIDSGALAAQLGKWETDFTQGMDRMRRLVCEYYDGFSFGRFVKRHPHKKGAITDLLIGDLFRDELDEVFALMDEMKAEQGAFEEPAAAAT